MKAAVWLVVAPTALLFFAGLLGIYVVDRIGRRPLLIWSMVGEFCENYGPFARREAAAPT